MSKSISFSVFAMLFGYLLFWPVAVDPVAWSAPSDNGYTGAFAQNQHLSQLQRIELRDAEGPEDYALSQNQEIFFSLASGDINYIDGQGTIKNWVNTGGRPLGIEFDGQGNLWVADALQGLLKVDAQKNIEVMVKMSGGIEVNYADDVDIAKNGKVYFSDASTKFHAKKYGVLAASMLDINEHGGHGRIIEYDTQTKVSRVIAKGLNFANGVAVSHDQNWLLVNETGSYRVLKVGINGDNLDQVAVVIDNLPGFPDNINQGSQGLYWLGLVSPRSQPLDALSGSAFLRKIVQRLPEFMRPKAQHFGHVVAINAEGDVVHNLQDPLGMYGSTTGALEVGGDLYISSLSESALAKTVNVNKPLSTAILDSELKP